MYNTQSLQADAILSSTYPSHLQTAPSPSRAIEPTFVGVKHYAQCQRYKDRTQKWIKLHYALLFEDPDFNALDEVQQLRYLKLLMLASRYDNRIPLHAPQLRLIFPHEIKSALTPLITSGMLVTFCRTSRRKVTAAPRARAGVRKKDSEIESKSEEVKKEVKKEKDRELGLRLGARNQPATLFEFPVEVVKKIPRHSTPLPPDWKYNDRHRELADAFGLNVHVEWNLFKDRCLAKGETYADWDAAFRVWLRKGREFKEQRATAVRR
jgi:hypothetical protein